MNTVSQQKQKPATFKENLRELEEPKPRKEPNFDAVIEGQRQRNASRTSPQALTAYQKQRRKEIGSV